ncbi:Cache 3/Cache 2 fusion domain-containing protein [Clostridium neuense]|uniref:histidine kinase n=1 Tax=Clostridium neuense TaxID=1728934 RepID=A0ABW8TJ56_9CLOT
MRIKYKLIISYLVLIIFTISILGVLVALKAHNEFLSEINEKNRRLTESIETTLSVRNELLKEKSYGDSNFASLILSKLDNLKINYNENVKVGEFKLPVLYAGNQRISLNNSIVDELKQSTGTAATIFLLHENKLVRVSSTISEKDKKLIGTYILSSSDIYKKIINDKEYTGDILINGIAYVTRIKPLLDKDKKVIGAIGVGNKILNNYLEKTLSNIKLGKTGYSYIIDSDGKTIIHPFENKRHATRHKHLVRKILSSDNGTIEYTTHNGVKKVAYYEYFAPWRWYIITAVNYDELNSSYKSTFIMSIAAGIVIIIIAGIAAVLIANNFIKPINELKDCIEAAGKGDLTVHCSVDGKDEIAILASSFNNMMAENKSLVEKTLQYDKLKTEFIANMSHELRTPLNIIFSTVQLFDVLIGKGDNLNTDKIRGYTGGIKQNCYRLVRLVNNLIDITKIDSGFMNLNLSNQNIVEVAEEITQSTAEYVQNMSRTIIFDTNEEEKVMAFDAEKLERILLNLISNAVKFTKTGDIIYVALYVEENQVTIAVRDTGIGIPEEKLSQLFKRFKQIDPLLSRSHEGSGIGLTIVKALVELHEGTIKVKSKYGEGTEFVICLPAKVIPEEENVKGNVDFAGESNVQNINIEFSDIYK